jgi:serine/threonine-protein kinase HipA
MVFNIVGRNQDDHVKNIAFLMNKQGEWSLSPAFDMTYSFNPTGAFTSSHQMMLNFKQDDFVLDDFKACAKTASMKRGRAETIINEVQAVVSRWQDYADEVDVLPEQRDKIQNVLRLEPFT